MCKNIFDNCLNDEELDSLEGTHFKREEAFPHMRTYYYDSDEKKQIHIRRKCNRIVTDWKLTADDQNLSRKRCRNTYIKLSTILIIVVIITVVIIASILGQQKGTKNKTSLQCPENYHYCFSDEDCPLDCLGGPTVSVVCSQNSACCCVSSGYWVGCATCQNLTDNAR